MATYSEGEAHRHIVLQSDDDGDTWRVATISGGSGENVYVESEAMRVILLESDDDGDTWTPVLQPSAGGGGSFTPTESADPATTTLEELIQKLIDSGLLLDANSAFLLLQSGDILLLQNGDGMLLQ